MASLPRLSEFFMINGAIGSSKNNSLMGEYASLLGDAILRQRTRAAEQKVQIEADLANQVKSQFISTMSHELRTPLNTIIGFSKMLSEQERRNMPAAEVAQYAGLIHKGGVQLLALINDILDLSKIQSGRYTIDHHEVHLDEVLTAAVSAHKAQADAAQISLTCRMDTNLPTVRGDASKLLQAVASLLNNAIKFNVPGGKVTVDATRNMDGGASVLISDTGIGMTDEEVAVALKLFGQVDGGKARSYEGTGLGLPIAKALVELHGGRLDIRTTKGQGTIVAVQLPSKNHVSTAG
jgi:two-component system, cell cycle sensor histidine kinase PleC